MLGHDISRFSSKFIQTPTHMTFLILNFLQSPLVTCHVSQPHGLHLTTTTIITMNCLSKLPQYYMVLSLATTYASVVAFTKHGEHLIGLPATSK